MKRIVVVFATYLIVLLVIFFPAISASADQLLFGDDIHRSYYFFRQYFAQSVREGVFPWWNPYLFTGQPFAAHPQALLAFYPPNWLFAIIPVAGAFSWYMLFHILIAMTGMYWFVRRFAHALAAWTAGLVFGLSGYFFGRIWAGHADVVAASSWIPWVFGWYWLNMMNKKPLYTVVAGIFLAIQLFAGYQSVALFTLEAVTLSTLFFCASKRSLRPLLSVVIATAIGFGLASVQILPQQEFAGLSIRSYPLPYEWASDFAMNGKLLKLLVNPALFGEKAAFTGQWPNIAEYLVFIGIVPLTLSAAFTVWALVKRTSTPIIWVLFGIAFFSIWVSFGRNAPIDILNILWDRVPFYHYFRLPSRHLVLFVFAVSSLAGLAIDNVRHRTLRIALVGVILIEVVPFAMRFIETKPIPEIRHDKNLVDRLTGDSSTYRLLPNFGVWTGPRDALDFDAAMSYRIFSSTGYDPSILRNYYEFIDAANGRIDSSILEHNVQVPYLDVHTPYANFLNIKYLLVSSWSDPLGGASQGSFEFLDDDPVQGLRLYENRALLPRFFMVSQAKILPDREAIADAIRTRTYDLSTTVLFDGTKATSVMPDSDCQQPPSDVTILDYSPNAIALKVIARCSGYLVSSEVFYPGWEAKVDGEKVDMYEGNMAFRTLFIKEGKHTVIYRFFPHSFVVGGTISLITILGCFVLARIRLITHE